MQSAQQKQLDDMCQLWRDFAQVSHAAGQERNGGLLRELAPVAIGVICLVAEQPDIILREIGERLSLPKTTLTSLLDRLEKRGFLQRVISSRDRRSFGLALYELGWQAYREQHAFEERCCRQMLAAFTGEYERAQFLMMFQKVVRHLQQLDPDAPVSDGSR